MCYPVYVSPFVYVPPCMCVNETDKRVVSL